MKTINKKVWFALGGVFLFSLLNSTKSSAATAAPAEYAGQSFLGTNNPRGIRNNNPGNLKISANNWKGKIPVSENNDGTFEQFWSYKWGVRAMIRLIVNYYEVQNRKTIRQILNRYAPNSENPTSTYINWIAQKTGMSADTVFSPTKSNFKKLIRAMAEFENGKSAITSSQFNAAWKIL